LKEWPKLESGVALARQAPDVETTQRINRLIAELEQKLREIDE